MAVAFSTSTKIGKREQSLLSIETIPLFFVSLNAAARRRIKDTDIYTLTARFAERRSIQIKPDGPISNGLYPSHEPALAGQLLRSYTHRANQ